jgi:hypothetical protein
MSDVVSDKPLDSLDDISASLAHSKNQIAYVHDQLESLLTEFHSINHDGDVRETPVEPSNTLLSDGHSECYRMTGVGPTESPSSRGIPR